MSTFNVGIVPATRTVLFSMAPNNLPANFEGSPVTNLGTFQHDFDDRQSSLPGFSDSSTHTIYHHIREILYHRSAANPAVQVMFPEGIYDMQRITIRPHGALAQAL